MTHPTIEAMARAICDAAFPVNPNCLVELSDAETGDKTSIPAWQLYGLEPAKAAARALLTAGMSKEEIAAVAQIIFDSAGIDREYDDTAPPHWVINVARNCLKFARAAQIKEMGL